MYHVVVQAELSDTVSSSDTSETVGDLDVDSLSDSHLIDMCRLIVENVDADAAVGVSEDPYS